jgi:phenol hydroxylase P4 protein
MFCAPFAFPLPPTMPFGAVQSSVIPGAFKAHPECSKIDWNTAQWFKSGKPWTPDPAKSLAENGLQHKDVIRFRTPGLTGFKGSCS